MAAKLLMYYPENDLALAAGTASYTPPPAARALHRAGEALPLWMARPGDRFVCSGLSEQWYTDICGSFGIEDVDVYDHSDASLQPSPWGWSLASRRALESAGYPAAGLPDDAAIARLRELSHRRTAITFRQSIAPLLPFGIAEAAEEALDSGSVERYLARHPAVIAKAPWSCSGRGIVRSGSMPVEAFLQQCAGIIRRQGSVMLEPEHDKALDFALLFECDGCGLAAFRGISVFATTPRGGYTSNVVAPQPQLHAIVDAAAGPGRLDAIIAAATATLPAVVPGYRGPLGIDMLVTASGLIDASVELNLRYTMGFVALGFSRYLAPEARASLDVVPSPQAPAAGATITNGLLAAGELDLTPPGKDFAFRARVHL
ncbi:MAG: hypothetical protein K2L21_08005 [Muribaculaceae bacterium]|nr:hypothetical protein [Muribaculaceae bacterium]